MRAAKIFIACALLSPVLAWAGPEQEIDEASIMIEEAGFSAAPRLAREDEEPGTIDTVKNIVNYAFKVIDFIEANRPVVNIETDYASAVPEQMTHWSQMTGWQGPDSKLYRFTARNLAGITVVDASYRVHYIWGGSYKGRGRYLTGVTIEPVSITTGWACTLSASAEVKDEDISNMGTEADPVASMVLRLKWKVKTFSREIEEEAAYHVLGNGTLQGTGKLFDRGLEARSAARAAEAAGKAAAPAFN